MRINSLLVVALLFANFAIAQSPKSADQILDAAYSKAKAENKNIFVIFHASWCGWCKKLDASMKDSSIKKYFDDNYVIVHLTVQETVAKKNLENPGALELMQKYNGEKAGLPFFIILDKNKKLLADSFSNGENIGCPAQEDEIAHFIVMLKKTSKLKKDALDTIAERFKKNKSH